MDKLFDKLDQYDILNNLIPGTMYLFLIKQFFGCDIGTDNVIEFVVIAYIFGIVIGRFGSICIEPIAKKIKLVKYVKYKKYIKAETEDKDKKITKLNMINNMYRSLLAMSIIVALTGAWLQILSVCPFINAYKYLILIVALTVLFAFSYRKQTRSVRKRVKYILKMTENR